MKISKAHRGFACRLRFFFQISEQDVLNHPENYLGPNWEAVIDFWLYINTLSYEQLRVAQKRYYALSDVENNVSKNKVLIAAKATAKYPNCAGSAAYLSVSYEKLAADYATLELIGLEKLLKQGYKPVFFPMFLNL
jgi:hypothetical protein